ncbi:DTW domain-containing protein [Shewanella maritima]|uniref:tRNA-uridine aminocarboxypropyltransferase n=1 Tax=Shewanella maritima TaxID=2520507 RepID=A0A411PL42_9GAMM|nr:tRNA-uridine aminocarboxypropyltransferase [Shewanella maritima]QBF84234.1 DTW domain-containing protein [Shewanella maritima]
MFEIILLTHSRELMRPSNTGKLVAEVYCDCLVVEWQRKEPDQNLLARLQTGKYALVYKDDRASSSEEHSAENGAEPSEVSRSIQPITESVAASSVSWQEFAGVVIIDSTWQEARKIYNKSPYLHSLAHVYIASETESSYQLRRNQVDGGLCTAECAAHLLAIVGQQQSSDNILAKLAKMQQAPNA